MVTCLSFDWSIRQYANALPLLLHCITIQFDPLNKSRVEKDKKSWLCDIKSSATANKSVMGTFSPSIHFCQPFYWFTSPWESFGMHLLQEKMDGKCMVAAHTSIQTPLYYLHFHTCTVCTHYFYYSPNEVSSVGSLDFHGKWCESETIKMRHCKWANNEEHRKRNTNEVRN